MDRRGATLRSVPVLLVGGTVLLMARCQQPADVPVSTLSSATLEVHVYGVFGLYPQNRTVSGSEVSYEKLHVLAPRGAPKTSRDLASIVGIPKDAAEDFLTDWHPAHYAVVQVPFKNLASGSKAEGMVTIRLGGALGDVGHHDTWDDALSVVTFPCDEGEKRPVTMPAAKEALIPLIVKSGPGAGLPEPAGFDLELLKDAKVDPVAARIEFGCGEAVTTDPRKWPMDDKGKPVYVKPAYLKKSMKNGKVRWDPTPVPSAKPLNTGGEAVVTRSVGSTSAIIINGVPLPLYADGQGKIKIFLRNAPANELLPPGMAGPPQRMSFEHFRLLYALVAKDDKQKSPYYYYTWVANAEEGGAKPPAGSPYCDSLGRFKP